MRLLQSTVYSAVLHIKLTVSGYANIAYGHRQDWDWTLFRDCCWSQRRPAAEPNWSSCLWAQYREHFSSECMDVFLEEQMRQDHIEYLWGVGKYHEKGYPTHLPQKGRMLFYMTQSLIDLEQQLQKLTLEKADPFEVYMTKKRIQMQKHHLHMQALKESWDNWVQKWLEGKILSGGKSVPDDIYGKISSVASSWSCQSASNWLRWYPWMNFSLILKCSQQLRTCLLYVLRSMMLCIVLGKSCWVVNVESAISHYKRESTHAIRLMIDIYQRL